MGNKLYKLLSTISITGVFIVVGILVCSITSLIDLNYIIGGILAIIAVLCISCILSLPWIKQLEEKNKKIIAVVFLSIISICAIFWIIFIIMVMASISKDNDLGKLELNILRFSLLLTIQVLVASTVANVILKYKKSMIAFQLVTYLSNFLVDLYFTILLFTVNISDDGLSFKTVPDFMGSKIIITLLIIGLIYVMLSNTIMKIIDKKKVKAMVYGTSDENNLNNSENDNIEKNKENDENDVKTKLANLKELLDNNLISQEDYDNKKAEILKDL